MDDKGQRNRHLLTLGCEEENFYPGLRGENGAIDFFGEREIRWHHGGAPGARGLTRNMASSQVACVNFMLPLASVEGGLLAIARAVDSDVREIVSICHEGNTTPVEFEWIGLGRSLEGKTTRGANTTNVDTFIVAETEKGYRAYLMEWKYTEGESYLSMSPKYLGEGYRKDRQLKGYADLYYADSSSFDSSIPMDELFYDPFDQIMRNRLLADRMVANGELGVSEAKVVVVVPGENLACRAVTCGKKTTSPPLAKRFPDLNTVDDVMRATLKNPDAAFKMVTPNQLLEAVVDECGEAVSDWAGYIRERYGW